MKIARNFIEYLDVILDAPRRANDNELSVTYHVTVYNSFTVRCSHFRLALWLTNK
jgi:hypothetical protein